MDRQQVSSSLFRAWRIGQTLCLVILATISSASADCIPNEYGGVMKQNVIGFLKKEYGDAYSDFDVDYPGFANVNDPSHPEPADPTRVYLAFFVVSDQHGLKRDSPIVVGFDRCSGKVVDSFGLSPRFLYPYLILLLLGIIYIAPTFIYLDATRHSIGRLKGERSGLLKNWRAADWALCCYCLGPLGWAAYAWKRKRLIAFAKEHPVRVVGRQRATVTVILLVLGLISTLLVGAEFYYHYSHIGITPGR